MEKNRGTLAYGSKNILSVEPHPHDVLFGRGKKTSSHPGNRHFQFFVKKLEEKCVLGPKENKPFYANYIINRIESLNPPGRFLKKDKNTGMWHEVSQKERKDKTLQALRDRAPEIIEKWGRKVDSDSEHKESTNELDQDIDSLSLYPNHSTMTSATTSDAHSASLSNNGNTISPSTNQASDTASSTFLPHPQIMARGNPSFPRTSQISSPSPYSIPTTNPNPNVNPNHMHNYNQSSLPVSDPTPDFTAISTARSVHTGEQLHDTHAEDSSLGGSSLDGVSPSMHQSYTSFSHTGLEQQLLLDTRMESFSSGKTDVNEDGDHDANDRHV
jgi:hypothetical protein